MTLEQIAFLVLWPIFSLIGIIAVYKNKKHNGKERFMFSVIFIIVPILTALFYLLVTYRTKVFFSLILPPKIKCGLLTLILVMIQLVVTLELVVDNKRL